MTYEWAWALGHGIPVIPLIFDEVKSSQIHARLNAIEWITCYPSIPSSLVDVLKNKMKKNRLHRYVDELVIQKCKESYALVMISLWIADYGILHEMKLNDIETLLSLATISLRKLSLAAIPDFWVQASHAFTTRQKQELAILGDSLSELSDSFMALCHYCSDSREHLFSSTLKKIEHEWRDTTEPTLASFDSNETFFWLSDILHNAKKHRFQSDEFWEYMDNIGNACSPMLNNDLLKAVCLQLEKLLGRPIIFGY